ncbi:MAG TPA: hypothetical protein VGJ45_09330 [Pseudonocardiaceae bacterium]|jgi:hypothetical protein
MRYALPVIVAAATLASAELSGQRAVLFPEGIALVFGAWVMRRADWSESRLRLVLALVLCATCGLAAANLAPNRLLAELCALAAAGVVLFLLPARVGPALSAAVLPTVFQIHSWLYPLSVLVIAMVVAAGLRAGEPDRDQLAGSGVVRWPGRWFGACLLICAGWLVVVALVRLPAVAAAPPLLVSALELMLGKPVAAREIIVRAVFVALAWVIGALAAWRLHPEVLAGCVAVALASALLWFGRTAHAPVLAMALVPEVAGPPATWTALGLGALAIVVAIAVLYLLGTAASRSRLTLSRE